MATSDMKGQGIVISTHRKRASDILTSTMAAFCSIPTQTRKGIERLI